ncbi:MAG: UvrD-helicase domain-containing protein, partial [Longimicrobiales bacterium]
MSRTRKAARRDQLDLFVSQPASEAAPAEAGGEVAVEERPAQPTVTPTGGARERGGWRSAPSGPGTAHAEAPSAPTVPSTDVERTLPDASARHRIEADLDTNLMVEAGAGAGKTTAMVGRMVALVRSARASIEQIAAVTFTRKAAAELRERFQTALEAELMAARERGDAETAARTDVALREIDRAFIGTIHSFCARLLRERPLDAGVDPGFRELIASEETRLRREYWNTHVERLAAEGAPRLAELTEVGLKPAYLFTLFETLTDYPDVAFPAEPVARPDPSRARIELDALLDDAERLMPRDEPDAGWDELQTAVRTMWFYRRLGWEDDLRFLEALAQAFSRPNRIIVARWGATPEAKTAVKSLERRFNDFAAEEGTGGRTLGEWYAHRYPIALAFAGEAAAMYAAERRRSGELSFQDLLMLTAAMLRERAAARSELSARYRFLLVDEFQDTDPVQAEVLFLLASTDPGSDWRAGVPRPGSLFVVGDPKQSIYRFRRADITLYNQVKARFRTFGAVLELTSNFRSRPPIERFVNDTFRRYFPAQATVKQAPFAPMRVVEEDAEPQGVFFYTLRRQGRRDLDNDLARQDADRVASWIAARVRSGARAPGDFMVLT